MTIADFFTHTPIWVYVLFIYLVSRGLKGLKPGDVKLQTLAIIPVVFTVWGGHQLVQLYGLAPDAVAIWSAGMAIGIAIGFLMLRNTVISVDRAQGIMHRPRDLTLLPMILAIFFVKYAFGAMGSISPALLMEPLFRTADLGLSGLFTGMFIGKFAGYAIRYFSAPRTVQP